MKRVLIGEFHQIPPSEIGKQEGREGGVTVGAKGDGGNRRHGSLNQQSRFHRLTKTEVASTGPTRVSTPKYM
jgi:hypothetical protein